MEKDLLCQYGQMVNEMRDLQKRIQKVKAALIEYEATAETVTAGRKCSRTIGKATVRGVTDRAYSARKTELLRLLLLYETMEDKLAKLTADIEEFIQTIEDSRIRQIIRVRYTRGADGKITPWVKVALMLHETEDSCRKAHDRFLEKELKSVV